MVASLKAFAAAVAAHIGALLFGRRDPIPLPCRVTKRRAIHKPDPTVRDA